MSFSYSLPIPDHASRFQAQGWLLLGISAVAASGLFSILLVLARTPFIQSLIPWSDFFHTALVVHVILSVLIWFIAFICTLWSLDKHSLAPIIDRSALYLAILGTLLIICAPFTGPSNPLLNNYIPILQQSFFMVALFIFGLGFCLRSFSRVFAISQNNINVLVRGNDAMAINAAIALIILFVSWLLLGSNIEKPYHFERLFWGFGHILQICYSVAACIVWLWLAHLAKIKIPFSPYVTTILLYLVSSPVLFAPVIYFLHDINSFNNRFLFTQLMTYGGLFILPFVLVLPYKIFTAKRATEEQKIAKAALICSLILFLTGGALAFLIQGANVMIPAHYHGSVVGITLAFFGMTYYLLPLLGFRPPPVRLAVIQLYLYAIGQFTHITGLAWSGGYGIQRKTAGKAQNLDQLSEILSMGLMGLGGLVAIIGGILFIIIVLKMVWRQKYQKN